MNKLPSNPDNDLDVKLLPPDYDGLNRVGPMYVSRLETQCRRVMANRELHAWHGDRRHHAVDATADAPVTRARGLPQHDALSYPAARVTEHCLAPTSLPSPTTIGWWSRPGRD